MAGSTSGVLITQNGDDVDIVLFQGKTVNFTITWGGSSPINVTGFTGKLQARKSPNTDALVEFSNANSRISMGGSDGIITISMTAAHSAALTPFEGVYDFELTDGSGKIMQVMSGKFKVAAEITK